MLRLVVIGVVLLALVSALLVVLVPRWSAMPETVLADPNFTTLAADPPAAASGAATWQRIGAGRVEPIDGGVRLVNDDPSAIAGLEQLIRIPAGAQAFRVTATVTLRDVLPGAEPWQRPRLVIQGVGADGRAGIGGGLQLIDRVGDFGPKRLGIVYPVGSPRNEAVLTLRLQRATGVLEVRDLVVEPAFKPPARKLLRQILIPLWLGIGAVIGGVVWWQSPDRLAASCVLGGLALLAVMVLLPHAVRQPLHNLLDEFTGGRTLQLLKPLLHVCGFATLALASRLAQPRWPLALFVVAWLAAAVLLELAEIFFSNFDPGDWIDMAYNTTGVVIGLGAAALVLRRRRDRAASPDPVSLSAASRRP